MEPRDRQADLARAAAPDDVFALTFSADGARLVSLAGGGLFLWDVASATLLFEVPLDRSSFDHAAFSADGRSLYARDINDQVWRWSVAAEPGTLEAWSAVEKKGRFTLDRGRLVQRDDRPAGASDMLRP